MDIEETKKFILNKIENDNLVKKVRDVIKINKWQKQDAREGFSESFKPLIESQEKVSEDINKQQKKTLEKLEANQEALTKSLFDNQLALTEGIRRLALRDKEEEFPPPPIEEELPPPPIEKDKENILDKLSSEEVKKNLKPSNIKINLEKDFDSKDIDILIELNLVRPKNLIDLSDDSLKELIDKSNDIIKQLNAKRAGLYKKKIYATLHEKLDLHTFTHEQI